MRGEYRGRVRVFADNPAAVVATVDVADTIWSRTAGLLGRSDLQPATGMLLRPCRSVHTCFMRFNIDVVFMTLTGEVVRTVDTLAPFSFVDGGQRARMTLEIPAGTSRRTGIRVGQILRFETV